MRRRWKACISAPMPGHGWRTVSPMSSTTGRPDLGGTRNPSPGAWRCSWATGRSGPARGAFAPWSRSIRPWARAAIPCLFQTGETADGKEHLVDRQHHHLLHGAGDFLSVPLAARDRRSSTSAFPASPRSAPRRSCTASQACATRRPPSTHDWLDSTHITFGVATLGASQGPFQLEGSWFNGREPDQFRWNIETRRSRLLVDAPLVQSDPGARPCRSATAT